VAAKRILEGEVSIGVNHRTEALSGALRAIRFRTAIHFQHEAAEPPAIVDGEELVGNELLALHGYGQGTAAAAQDVMRWDISVAASLGLNRDRAGHARGQKDVPPVTSGPNSFQVAQPLEMEFRFACEIVNMWIEVCLGYLILLRRIAEDLAIAEPLEPAKTGMTAGMRVRAELQKEL